MKHTVIRYAAEGTTIHKEDTLFQKLPDNANHPSMVTPAGQTGNWLFMSIGNPFKDYGIKAKFDAGDPVDPTTESLPVGYVASDEAAYDQFVADQEAANAQSTADAKAAVEATMAQKIANMETALLRVGFTAQEVEYFK